MICCHPSSGILNRHTAIHSRYSAVNKQRNDSNPTSYRDSFTVSLGIDPANT
ncbi:MULTISPECIES: hypothetical protein [unclassified Wolbachia]|uniref:hypothetical protein n=1 Tax=unclassified Wolbachia TaxID=2640676 RepID=UPI0012E9767B|nr:MULTISPECIES: hypothetical protein [unclassified Wolbachia]